MNIEIKGVLANVDYNDPITLFRARELAIEASNLIPMEYFLT